MSQFIKVTADFTKALDLIRESTGLPAKLSRQEAHQILFTVADALKLEKQDVIERLARSFDEKYKDCV